MIERDLKPCPFCGAKVDLFESTDFEGCFDIQCQTQGCYLRFGADWYFEKHEIYKLIEMWNRRVV